MLKARIITAIFLAIGFLAAVFFLPTGLFSILMGVTVLAAAYEWSAFASMKTVFARVMLTLGLAVCMWLFHINPLFAGAVEWVLYAAAIWWMLVFFAVMMRSKPIVEVTGFSPPVMLFAFVVLIPAWIAIVMLHAYPDRGPFLLLYAFSIVWIADIAAFFAGRRFGKVKLAPLVSPGKTREGMLGALGCLLAYSALMAYLFDYTGRSMMLFISISMIAGLLSVGGDLFESLMKRRVGLKDSGNILPGHGGLMDRLDSVTAALPVFLAGMLWTGLLR